VCRPSFGWGGITPQQAIRPEFANSVQTTVRCSPVIGVESQFAEAHSAPVDQVSKRAGGIPARPHISPLFRIYQKFIPRLTVSLSSMEPLGHPSPPTPQFAVRAPVLGFDGRPLRFA
jgi:hypothetical protein